MSRSLNDRPKGPRIFADVLVGSLWTALLFGTGNRGLHEWWEYALFGLSMLFIGVNVKDIAEAITEPDPKPDMKDES